MKSEKSTALFKKKSVIVFMIIFAVSLIAFGIVMGVCYSIKPGTYSDSTIKFNGAEFEISVRNAGWTDQRIWFSKEKPLDWIIEKIEGSDNDGFSYAVSEKTDGVYEIKQKQMDEVVGIFFLRMYEENKYVISLTEELLYFD